MVLPKAGHIRRTRRLRRTVLVKISKTAAGVNLWRVYSLGGALRPANSTVPRIDARPTTLALTWSGSSENPMSPVQDGCRDNSGIDSGPDVSTSAATGDEPVCGATSRRNEAMKVRLLLIEDDKETADEIRAELGDHGFEVDWAANGIEGFDKARSSEAEAMIV